jgi:lipopolysaccharide/colanic/teichoic acid biosynthesis glycosyltransferase
MATLNTVVDRLFFTKEVEGKDGKPLKVYKLRTMRKEPPGSEDFEIKEEDLGLYGKVRDDLRITRVGRFLRRFYLDEIPQLFNLLKGELSLVGLRPLFPEYGSLFPNELKEKRKKYKPGIMNAIYAYEHISSHQDRVEAEMRYLKEREYHPCRTQLTCFFKIVYRILTGELRGV